MSDSDDCEKELENLNSELKTIELQISKLKRRQTDIIERRNKIKNDRESKKSKKLGSLRWDLMEFSWSASVLNILHDTFKIKEFRPQQLSVINATLKGHHTLVVMPTGAGKSLCYQLPALTNDGITIVVSPLISLMEDQVTALQKKNVNAKLMTSTSPKEETTAALNDLTDKKSPVKLLYVTPERFAKSKRFMSKLQKCYAEGRLQRFAIDEVHCCSQWGHDFRPDYKFLGILSSMFTGIPILGLTATATSQVMTDVKKMLNLSDCLVIKSTFNRPNLFYQIMEKPTAQNDCLDLVEKLIKYRYKNKSGIIYTTSIKDCEEVAQGLRNRGLKVACYHANLEAKTRSTVHNKWYDMHYQAVVATVAFGMGIDKPDVRFVIHYSISKAMESYYQESGRAGRDGQRAECVTLYRLQDVFKLSTMVFSSSGNLENLYGLVKYCLNGNTCRRKIIAEHFEESWGNDDCNKMCDVCCDESAIETEISIKLYCKQLGDIILKAESLDTKVTAQKLIDAWFLCGPTNIRLAKATEPNISRSLAEDVLAHLIVEGFLREDFHFTPYTTISYIKRGPNYSHIQDSDFVVKMSIRKYKKIDLMSPAPATLLNTNKRKDSTPPFNGITKKSKT